MTLSSGTSRHAAYVRFRIFSGILFEKLEKYAGRFFGEGSSPFALSGAIAMGLFMLSTISGLIILVYYNPSPGLAWSSIREMTTANPLMSFVRMIHRASADLLMLAMLFHGIRNWATGRFRGARTTTWIKGLAVLPLVGLIAWAGYVLVWDSRSMVLLEWGRDMVLGIDRWPLVGLVKPGSLIGWPIFSAGSESELLLRIFALHIGGAFLMAGMVLMHTRFVTPPKLNLHGSVWIGILLLTLLLAALMPTGVFHDGAYNPFEPSQAITVDAIANFPLLFYPLLGGAGLAFVMLLTWLALALIPSLESERKPAAVVIDSACTGCRLCFQDCPYGAIEMAASGVKTAINERSEIAKVNPKNCNSCGICVGSCEFGAIELTNLTSSEITNRIDVILRDWDQGITAQSGGGE